MTEQPTVQSADTDGNGPARRRRRPALSCVECRMRKVKCDRGKPCGACTRIGSATCTYRPPRAGIRSHGKPSPDATSESASGSHEQDQEQTHSTTFSSSIPRTSSQFDLMVNRYIAPGVFGEHGHPKLKPLPADRPSLDLGSHEDDGKAAIISILLERIKILEGKREDTTSDSQSGNTTAPIEPGLHVSNPGQFVKSKFYGQSHWMNAIEPYDALGESITSMNLNTNRREVNKSGELYANVAEFKRMARIIKASRMLQLSISSEVQISIPAKDVCDSLVECYFRTFESVFRVLHIPTFRREYEEYWGGTVSAKPSVLFKILLVCAIGVPFYTGSEQAKLRSSCAKWIQAATEWLHAPHRKSRLNMAGLQIQILVLLARQMCNIDGDYIWIPAGSLLRTAMHLGLHRDPSNFGKISVFHTEMRRRLWATVLEITAQSSLDMGMPPMVSVNDYDTKSPSNVNDDDISENIDQQLDTKALTIFTDSSIQIALTQTLPVRLEIIRLINNLRFDLSYREVLRLGTQLTKTCRENTVYLRSALAMNCNISPFQIKLSDTLVRRFVLCLHRPYFAKASEDPQYHYSRKVCLDTSLAIYAPATDLQLGETDDWTRMTHRCVGFFKSFFLYAMSTVYFELHSQINERMTDAALFAPMVSVASATRPIALPTQVDTLRNVLKSAREVAIARLHNGETNAKGAAFLTCALARLDAIVSGADAEAAVLEAAKTCVRETSEILVKVYREEHGKDIDLNPANGPFAGRNKGRGDGTDDVRGSNALVGSIADEASDGNQPNLVGEMDDMNVLDDGIGNNIPMDLDLDAYFQGQTMNGGPDYHFTRSPEWFYDLHDWPVSDDMAMDFNAFTT